MAQATLKEMEKWYEKTQDAGYLMCQAHLYALWGEKEKAVDLVKTAFKNAFPYGPYAYQNDVMLAPLQGYAPFDEFVQPKP